MNTTENITTHLNQKTTWKIAFLLLLLLASLMSLLSLAPITQSSIYHLFADSRQYFLIKNFFDVFSNLPFLVIGVYGYLYCRRSTKSANNNAWMMMFLGIALVGIGSAYYHYQPDYDTLFWDRLPMTIAFMSLFSAITGEYISEKITSSLLLPIILFGISSVIYWYFSNDLRLYLWVQLAPLLTITIVMMLFKSRYSHQWLLLVALAFYLLAKVTEFYDDYIFQWTLETLSGHSIKHLLASISCYFILLMLMRRKDLSSTF